MQPGYQNGPPKAQVYIAFEISGPTRDDGQPFVLGKRYTASLFEKAALFEVVDSLLGKVPAVKEFNPGDLLGKCGLVKVSQKTRTDGSVSAQVDSVIGLPLGMPKPEASQSLLFYSWNEPDRDVYDQLPEWLRNVIDAGEELPKPTKPPVAETVPSGNALPW
jgi:hypothetical protein